MEIVGREHLTDFTKKHSDARSWIECWVAEAEAAKWKSPTDIKRQFSTASFLSNNVVVFNVKGNHYRMEIKVAYNTGKIKILWLGTHAEYDRRNKTGGRNA